MPVINSSNLSVRYPSLDKSKAKINNTQSKQSNHSNPINTYIDFNIINQALKAQALAKSVSFTGYKEVQTFDVPFYDDLKGKFYQLDNGQKVIVIPRPGPTMLQTFVKVGSFNEPDNIRGISHFIEHSLFNGSKDLAPGEFNEKTHQMGAEINAFTSYDETAYYVKSIHNQQKEMDETVRLHANILQYPSFSQDQIEKEKGTVSSEIQMMSGGINSFMDKVMLNHLFGIKTNAKDLIAGSEENIKRLTREDVVNYYNTWYTPDNMTTVIIGDVKPDNIIKLVDKHFSSKNTKSNPQSKHYEHLNPIQKTRFSFIPAQGIGAGYARLGFIGPKNNDVKESLLSSALNIALTGYENALVPKLLAGQNIQARSATRVYSSNLSDPQVMTTDIQCEPGKEEDALNGFSSLVGMLKNKPLGDKEIKTIKGKLVDGLTRASEYSSYMTNLVGNAIVQHGDIKAYTNVLEAIDSITPQDIQEAARKYFDFTKASITVVSPVDSFSSGRTLAKKAPQDISFGSNLDKLKLGNIKNFELPNNVRLIINDNPNSIRSSSSVCLETEKLPPHKPGVAYILAAMMGKGSANISEQEFKDIADTDNIIIAPSVRTYSIEVETDNQAKNLPLALDLAKEIIYNPNLSEENFNKAKNEITFALKVAYEDPTQKAMHTLYRDHPYGYTVRSIQENIDKITLQDVKDLYNYFIQNSQAQTTITGPISKTAGLQDKIVKSMETVPQAKKYGHTIDFKVQPLDENKVNVTIAPVPQAQIIQMFDASEAKSVEDKAALTVLNHVLGGDMSSRLFQDLRTKKNLAYSVRSNFISNPVANQFMMIISTSTTDYMNGMQIPNNNFKKSIEGFKQNLQSLIENPVSQDELESAKLSVISKTIFGSESAAGKTHSINAGQEVNGKLYITQLLEAIDKVKPEDIQRVGQKYLTKPSVLSIMADYNTVAMNVKYLQDLGDLNIEQV
ncbi:MAG: Peptidase M16-like protein [uncultured bacterium]|nr:MAG: Peptidase M16-like protein [uncultured bacterium]HBH18187.1 hypothetical protein [Cyanobacteria bacterium UBA9579]